MKLVWQIILLLIGTQLTTSGAILIIFNILMINAERGSISGNEGIIIAYFVAGLIALATGLWLTIKMIKNLTKPKNG